MSQTYDEMLAKVQKFHEKHNFASDENNGHDMSYRILLTIEELADLLILIIGHSIAMDVNLEEAFNKKMTEIMKRPAIMGDLGIRVTNYES